MPHFSNVVLGGTAAIVLAVASPCFAENVLHPQSFWHEQRTGWCLEISKISDPLPGSDECVQISGSRGKNAPFTGYACDRQRSLGIFISIRQSDNSINNSITPDFLSGTYSKDKLELSYCTRISNDWPPEYDCRNGMTFKNAGSCPQ